jgi:hypothetical protein
MKKGLSDVVTTVLIILLALAAVVILWSFIKVFLGKTEDIDSSYFTTVFSIEKVNHDEEGKTIGFSLQRESGKGQVSGYLIELSDSEGNSYVYSAKENDSILELESDLLTINYTHFGLSNLEEINIYPIFVTDDGNEQLSPRPSETYIIKGGETSNIPMNLCGDGVINGNETCEVAQTCITGSGYTGFRECISCSLSNTCTPTQSCGDGVINGNEQCDGGDFGSLGNGVDQCNSYNSNYNAGSLGCTQNCQLNTSQCTWGNPPEINDIFFANQIGAEHAQILWYDNNGNLEEGFIFERSNGGGFVQIGQKAGRVVSRTDLSGQPGTYQDFDPSVIAASCAGYSYRIRAYNSLGITQPSIARACRST